MKNIEQILKEAGIEVTDEQKAAINKAMPENYKTIAEFDKQVKKTEKAESERDALQKQYDDAQETIKGFDGVDVEKLKKDIAEWKERAEKAEKDAADQILKRDQRDYLNAEFDKLGIKSERTRKSLMNDIMGEDGLKWKNDSFQGLSDYLKQENEKDHFYETDADKKAAEEEAKAQEEKDKAAGTAPKYTDRSEGKPVKDDKNTFKFNFNPIREVKKSE